MLAVDFLEFLADCQQDFARKLVDRQVHPTSRLVRTRLPSCRRIQNMAVDRAFTSFDMVFQQ